VRIPLIAKAKPRITNNEAVLHQPLKQYSFKNKFNPFYVL